MTLMTTVIPSITSKVTLTYRHTLLVLKVCEDAAKVKRKNKSRIFKARQTRSLMGLI